MNYNYRRRINGTRISEKSLPKILRNIRNIDVNSSIGLKSQKEFSLTSEETNHYLAFTEEDANNELRKRKFDNEEYIKYYLDNNIELKNIVTTLVDSCIVYNADNQFCEFSLNKKIYTFTPHQENILNSLFDKHMRLLKFTDEQEAWSVFYDWLCSGKVNYELIYKTITRKEKNSLVAKEKERISLFENKVKSLKNGLVSLNESAKKQSKRDISEAVIGIKRSRGIIKTYDLLEKRADKMITLNEDNFNLLYKIIDDKDDKDEIDEQETEDFRSNMAKKYRLNKDVSELENELIPIEIIGIKRLASNTTTRVDVLGEDGENIPMYKIQDINGHQVYLPKECVIEIDWGKVSGNSQYSHKSYVDTLRRNYNLTRSLEESRVGWNILVGQFRLKMIVPTGSKLGVKAKEAVSKLVNQYRERLSIDSVDGTVSVNGNKKYGFGKNIALPSRNGNTTQIDSVAYNGVDLSRMDVVDYFRDSTYRDSNIPKSRFDRENNFGNLMMFKSDGIPFDELFFHKMSGRLLNEFTKAIRLPIYYDAILKDPSLSLGDSLYNALRITCNADSYYEIAKEQELEKAKLSNLSSYERIQDSSRNPIFSMRFLLIEKFKVVSQEEWELNQKYVKEDKELTDDTNSI